LIICTIYEPVFIKKCENIISRIFPCFFKKGEPKVINDKPNQKSFASSAKLRGTIESGDSRKTPLLKLDPTNGLTPPDPSGRPNFLGDEEDLRAFEGDTIRQRTTTHGGVRRSTQRRLTENRDGDASFDDDEEDENFEEGSNQMIEMRSEVDIVDGQKFENLINQDFTDFNEKFSHMSIKQKTSYFVSGH
jgi:hypothetical protein